MTRLSKICLIAILVFITRKVNSSNLDPDVDVNENVISILPASTSSRAAMTAETQDGKQVEGPQFETEVVIALPGISEEMHGSALENFQKIASDFLSDKKSDPVGFEVFIKSCIVNFQNVEIGNYNGIAFLPSRNLEYQSGNSTGNDTEVEKSLFIGLTIVSGVYPSSDSSFIRNIVLKGFREDFLEFTERLSSTYFFVALAGKSLIQAPNHTPNPTRGAPITALVTTSIIVGGVGFLFMTIFLIMRRYEGKSKPDVEKKVSDELPSFMPNENNTFSFEMRNSRSIKSYLNDSNTDSNTDSNGSAVKKNDYTNDISVLSGIGDSVMDSTIPSLELAPGRSTNDTLTINNTVTSAMTSPNSIMSDSVFSPITTDIESINGQSVDRHQFVSSPNNSDISEDMCIPFKESPRKFFKVPVLNDC